MAEPDVLDMLMRAEPNPTRSRRIDVRVTEPEQKIFRHAATFAKLTLSEWMRAAALAQAKYDLVGRRTQGILFSP